MPKYCLRYASTEPDASWWNEMLVDVPAVANRRVEWCAAVLKGYSILAHLKGGIVTGCQLESQRPKWWAEPHAKSTPPAQ